MTLPSEAVDRFCEIFQQAQDADLPTFDAMTLATVRPDGRPSARTVLLKGVDENGFIFYTNKRSRKGKHLAENPHAALCMYWAPLGLQVLVEGAVEHVSDQQADSYFATRPRLSQIGAWASRQSEPLESLSSLELQVRQVEEEYAGREVPRPPHWGGYRVVPTLVEFWAAGDGRLHVRERYERDEQGGWSHCYLNP